MAADLALTDENFEAEVLKMDKPVLVDFWAQWCAPCRIVSPIIDELAKEYEGRLKVGKFNVDDNPNTPTKFGIMSIPTVLLFKSGQIVKTLVGVQGKENYRKAINEALR